jgi:TolA-binding protein
MRLVQTAGAAVVMTAASLVSYGAEPFDAESLRQSQGELLLQIEQLRQETQALRGLMEELSYQLGQMSSDQKTRYLDLDQRLGELVRIQKEAVAVVPDQGSLVVNTDSAVDGSGNVQAIQVPPVSDKQAYEDAFLLIKENKLEDGLEAMRSFALRYPNSDLKIESEYWIGQLLNALNRELEAIEVFKKITIEAPEFRKILQVKVKLGSLLIRNQDPVNGRKILEELILQAPESLEAGLARRQLEKTN